MKIGIIADDLTGANATGVKLVKLGFEAATMVYYDSLPTSEAYNAVCIDTDSRYAEASVAKMRVKKVMNNLIDWNADIICKRVDSTIRGNVGLEIDTVLSVLGEKAIAIVVPSYPMSGRIVSGGYLLVHGVPVQKTDAASDPVIPIKKSFVPGILQEQSEHLVSHISLEKILEGEEVIVQEIRKNIENGSRVIVMDAVSDDEIDAIANAMTLIKDYHLIPADPGPLSAAYSKAYTRKYDNKKILVTVGSITSTANEQLQYLSEKMKAKPIYVNARKLASLTNSWDEEINRVVSIVLKEIDKQKVIIITTNEPGAEQVNLKEIAEEEKVNQDQLAKRISDGLAKITRIVIEKRKTEIGGCFTSGGDVTASLCSIGKAEGIKLKDELLPLVAYGEFISGLFDGIPLVTKGGMAGDKKAIYTSVKYLLSKL